ncbi:MAG: hypothetical protein KC433_12050 [Anaerolineales bacterium]|nr:hypothetical protein [Anaerolineales bacterium]
MFDFLRNLTKSAEEKRQEAVAAYLDGALNNRERQRFEQEMAQDAALRAQVDQLLLIKQSLRRLPQRDVPRNFMLDPAAYGRPARQPWVQAYPVLRTATALAAFFFIFAIAAGIFTTNSGGAQTAMAPAADIAEIETTRVVTEVVIEATASLAFEAESAAEEEMADEEIAAESAPMSDTFEETMEEAETAGDVAESEAPTEEAMDAEAAPPEEPAAIPQATATALPTATVSTSPRVASPTPLPDRDLEQAPATDDAANGAIAEVPEPAVEDGTEAVETTAVLPEEDVQNVTVAEPVNSLLWLQLGLGALLLLLVGLTFYARRQR